MFKLAKYLKPFIGMLIAAVVLLFVQAYSDLSLPDYMSHIVNNGIQQGGIENAVPEAMRKSKMDKINLFISENDKEKVIESYTLVDKESDSYDKYVEKYPILKDESIYVLKDINKEKTQELNLVMGRAILTVSGIEKAEAQSKHGEISFAGMKVPANTDLFNVIKKLPVENRLKISDEAEKKFEALGDSMIIQGAIPSIKEEYKALGMDTDKIQSRYIMNAGVKMLLIALLAALCIVLVGFLASRIATGMAKNLRKDIFEKVESFSNVEFNKFSQSSLMTRTTNDVNQIQMVMVLAIRMLIYAPILGVGGILKAISKSSSMSWIIALSIVLLLVLIGSIFIISVPKFKAIQKLIDRLNLVTRENLSGIMVVRAFNTEKFEEHRFDKANQDLTGTNLFVNRVMAALFPSMMLIMNGITLLIVWVGADKIANSAMQVGDVMAFIQYAMQIIFAFIMMSFMFIMIPRASVSAQRVAEVLEVENEIVDCKNPKKIKENNINELEFKNVCFKYPGAEEDVLKNINFKALKGKTTAFIGATGSGKSTLINLIPRFYEVTDGEILIDGLDIKKLAQYDLRDKIGYMPQKASLFKGTIDSNLKYGDENASNDDIIKAAEIAQAMEFISSKEEGFHSEISQGGGNVSGGQKQRISIARALVKKAKIYIFDDSFSALDFKTDSALRKALNENVKDSIMLIVAQRISTIKNADQIIVLDEGKIVGIGKHDELMKKCKTYEEIALSQLSKEELN